MEMSGTNISNSGRTIETRAGAHTLTAAAPYPTSSTTPSTASTGTQVRSKLAQLR